MSEELDQVVKVLYDYKYTDEAGEIEIRNGDIYRLVEKTNNEWWQVYDPADADGESFFVPAQYVEVVSEESAWKALSDLDKALTFGDERSDSPAPDYNEEDPEAVYSTAASAYTGVRPTVDGNESYVNLNSGGGGDTGERDAEYINLDLYRNAAGLPTPSLPSASSKPSESPESPSAPKPNIPQELIQGTVPPPEPGEGTYVKVLLEGLPWDIYREHTANRLFYVNRETGERMWKPPRKPAPQQPAAKPPPDEGSTRFGPTPNPTVKGESWNSGLPPEYEQVTDNGNIYFIHKGTQEKDRGWNATTPPSRPVHLMPSPPTSSRPTLPAQEEVLEGYINKAKILDTGKKKVKKNWTQIYLVMKGSNLIFYKDQKSAAHDGRNEGVVSLQGAHVNFNPSKELTSRKNSILLQVSSGNLFLFQSDNEKTVREWFTRMKIVANDVSPSVFDSSPISSDVKEEKKEDKNRATTRSVSSDDSVSIHSVDKNRNMIGIRAKLLSLISRRPTQEDLYKRGIIKDAVFGSRLHELCDREKTHVPNFVHQCIQAVESKGLTHDGMYRVSGNMAEIQRLRCAVDKDDNYNLYDAQWDVHVLTGSLKLFFRELKEPLFPFNMYNTFLDAIRKENAKDRLSAFKKAVSDLPRCNYFTLKELLDHLCKIIEFSHENRMQVQNVAIVFGPTLMWQQEELASLAVSTMYQSKTVEYLLLECSSLFKH